MKPDRKTIVDEEQQPRREVEDLRGETTSRRDMSEHRRHTWLYEDLMA